ILVFFLSSRRWHTISKRDWSSDVCSSDLVPVSDVLRFESEFLQHLRLNNIALADIAESGRLNDDVIAVLEQEVTSFKKSFLAQGGDAVQPGNEEFDAIDEGAVEQERIVRQKR